MKYLLTLLFIPLVMNAYAVPSAESNNNMQESANTCPEALDFTVRALDDDKEVNLCQTYKGKLIMIVNTASKCGFTPQFEGLEALYEKYKDKGFVVLGFPSNDFANQDPGTEKQVAEFCRLTYGVKFPMFEKTHAAKKNASPIYKKLAELSGGKYPKWNFYKYVISPEGELIGNYSSFTKPNAKKIVKLIEANLPNK
ncbi:MAG: Glutathione peroxidase family protein [uncultured Thiotrichaceae bacterium]|uniref:Glutathione peroxidase n=1 Tax=uncultured Thiotrichaceae bacterium TaxID=298394 RepID=A0A6S6U2A1_9GAMM|nr:MAG: Glutathione peroxidase family protein [uncultured Thiotrichaceae bacterium]